MNKELKAFIDQLNGCPTCKQNPIVFITDDNIPLCESHWTELAANTMIEWEHVDFNKGYNKDG